MTLDDMRMLLTIAKCGNLTAAAQTLYVSQPALSKRLNRFEEELGAQLFERAQGAHRLTLTPAGKLLIPFAEKWEDLQQEVGMLHDINSRVHFFVDAVDSVGICVLSDAIYAYHQKRPDTELVLKQRDSLLQTGFIIHVQRTEGLPCEKGVPHPFVHHKAHRRIDCILFPCPARAQQLRCRADFFGD